MKCFYHSADLDGQCSGAIVKMKFPQCETIGINYGQDFPWERISPGEVVFMVDFSLPMDQMQRLNWLCSLFWVDHHKSAIEAARECGFGASANQLLEIGRAGCELTWQLCFNTVPPRAVFLLGRYDVWDHENHPGALEFQYGMRNAEDCDPERQEFWQRLFKDSHYEVDRLIEDGALLLAYEERQNAKYVASCAFDVFLDGLRCVAVNRGLTNSLLFKSIYDPAQHDAMLSFVRRPGIWTVSLYADKPEVDVSAVCKARGGGGHKGAAGFRCAELPF